MVRVTPRGGRDAVEGWGEDASGRAFLKLRVKAPPIEGQANAAAMRLLAQALGLPAAKVRLASGASARLKGFDIDAEEDWVRARLAVR